METRRELERACLSRAIKRGDHVWEPRSSRDASARAHAVAADTEDRLAAEQWESRHRIFHFALVSACGSPWRCNSGDLVRSRRALPEDPVAAPSEPAARVRAVNAEHQRIMEAVIARDEKKAARLMDAHLSATQRAVSPYCKPSAATRASLVSRFRSSQILAAPLCELRNQRDTSAHVV